MKVAVIMGDGVILRPLEMSDASIINKNIYTKENTNYMLYRDEQTIEETVEFLKESIKQYKKIFPKYFEFGIVYNKTLVGLISLAKVKKEINTYEIGWVLDKDYQHKGLAYSAACALIDYAKRLKVKKIIAHSDINNASSIALINRLGMKNTNVISSRTYKNGIKSYEAMFDLDLI